MELNHPGILIISEGFRETKEPYDYLETATFWAYGIQICESQYENFYYVSALVPIMKNYYKLFAGRKDLAQRIYESINKALKNNEKVVYLNKEDLLKTSL